MTHAFLHNLLFYSSVSNSNLCKISLTIPASSIKLIPKHFLPASFKDAPTWYAFVLSRSQSDIRNPLSLLAHNRITAPQFIRRSLQSSWYKQVPTHCLSLFATSAEDLPDSVIFSFTMNYTKTTWFLQSTFINILHINPRVFHGVWPQCGQLKPRMLKIQRFWAYILDFLYKYLDISS